MKSVKRNTEENTKIKLEIKSPTSLLQNAQEVLTYRMGMWKTGVERKVEELGHLVKKKKDFLIPYVTHEIVGTPRNDEL